MPENKPYLDVVSEEQANTNPKLITLEELLVKASRFKDQLNVSLHVCVCLLCIDVCDNSVSLHFVYNSCDPLLLFVVFVPILLCCCCCSSSSFAVFRVNFKRWHFWFVCVHVPSPHDTHCQGALVSAAGTL